MQMYGAQKGLGFGDIEVYTGPIHRFRQQNGAGIGKYFVRAYKYLRPLITSGINAVKDQGIDSTGSILRQLGTKDIRSILEDEGERALKNLGEKAISKIGRTAAKITQFGKGIDNKMSSGLSVLQMRRLGAALSAMKKKKKAIKSRKIMKKSHSVMKPRLGGFGIIQKHRRQIGGGRKKKKNR